MNFKNEIAKTLHAAIAAKAELTIKEIEDSMEQPANIEMGDFAFPCFKLSKQLKKSPQIIATEIAAELSTIPCVEKIETVAAYINFFVNKTAYVKAALENLLDQKDNFGSSNIGNGKVVTIDYSSPNIAKPFHVGHLRTTVIGHALYNIHNHLGYKTIGINHLGDWGQTFGKQITAYNHWGNSQAVEKDGINELVRIYVKYHDEVENNPALADEARANFLKLQEGDEENLRLWKWFCDISLKEFQRVYDILGIKFDYFTGESFYRNMMDDVVTELREKNLLVESEGAQVVMLDEFKMPPYLILRSDGGTLYSIRDIAAALYRKKTFSFSKSLYVTDMRQSLAFAQLFKTVELMGNSWATEMQHVPYGLVSMDTGALSTRDGKVIWLEDLFAQTIEKVRQIIEEKNPNLESKEQVAQQVGIGAIIFNDLYNSRIKDVIFSWDKMLNFDGETGPYVQYTYARASSVLRKAKTNDFTAINYDLISDQVEFCKLLNSFSQKVEESAEKLEPYIITRHIVDIAQLFNKFYHDTQLICEDEQTRNARLLITFAAKVAIGQGLQLLGIKAPEQM